MAAILSRGRWVKRLITLSLTSIMGRQNCWNWWGCVYNHELLVRNEKVAMSSKIWAIKLILVVKSQYLVSYRNKKNASIQNGNQYKLVLYFNIAHYLIILCSIWNYNFSIFNYWKSSSTFYFLCIAMKLQSSLIMYETLYILVVSWISTIECFKSCI